MPDPDDNPVDKARYVEVALPVPLRRTFTYSVPPALAGSLLLGARLLVPFGKRMLTGYAVGFHTDIADPGLDEGDIKDISEILDEDPLLTPEILGLAIWTADYYAGSLGEVLKASLPAGINAAVEQFVSATRAGRDAAAETGSKKAVKWQVLARIAESTEVLGRELRREFGDAPARRGIRELSDDGYVTVSQRSVTSKVRPKLRKVVSQIADPDDIELKRPLSDVQLAVLETLRAGGGEMLFTALLDKADCGASPVNTLAKYGILSVEAREVFRDPLAGAEPAEIGKITLNPEQRSVLNEIESALDGTGYSAFLLHGVTGSGKTEIYIRAMLTALKEGRSSLMLVPEIALTPIFSRRLRAVFGEEVAILHSNLSPGERFDEWRRIHAGKARIAIGTRSAVFAPLRDIGLLIVDEEHDASYRQNEHPFYNARDVAVVRAKRAGATVVLGSATPSLESFHNAQQGKYKYLHLRERIGSRPMAVAELIDMREVFRRAGKDVALSPQLIEALNETHGRGEQSIILLNRRGFSSFVLCRTCGESLRCKNCDITMTYHKRDGRLICHYCSHAVPTPRECPFCKSEFLYFIGQGTEQLEDIIGSRFPDLRIARVDRDSMTRKGKLTKTLFAFDRGELDMLVGTQMLAKGHDFHNVTLVGVISVDTGLGLPDFRSAERTFQLLTQVAGRAGRGDLPGRVLIQTYYPEHYALRYAAAQDFMGFYNAEMNYRRRMSYPPYTVLASIMIKHRDRDYALRTANILRDSMNRANAEKASRILGPAQASIAWIKNEYRFQIIIKSDGRRVMRALIDASLAEAETRGADRRIIQTEIDPISLL